MKPKAKGKKGKKGKCDIPTVRRRSVHGPMVPVAREPCQQGLVPDGSVNGDRFLTVIQNYETRLEDVRRLIGLTYLLPKRFTGTLILGRKSMDGISQRIL